MLSEKSNQRYFLHQNLDCPKVPKVAITFDLFPHSKSSMPATTSFNFSTKVAIERFPLLRKFSVKNYFFRFLRLISDSPKMSRSLFKTELSRFLTPVSP